ncbi:hypothetical protein Mapa_008524 [Marchantia paleacea]|nr:hypothetical protein Mapa_008524 [Marchantia paleacea]
MEFPSPMCSVGEGSPKYKRFLYSVIAHSVLFQRPAYTVHLKRPQPRPLELSWKDLKSALIFSNQALSPEFTEVVIFYVEQNQKSVISSNVYERAAKEVSLS